MPAPVGFGSNAVPPQAINNRPQNDTEGTDAVNGKAKDNPAQQARAAIKNAARSDGGPANLHGKVTSAFARGLDTRNLLVLQSVETTETETADIASAPATDADDGSADPADPAPANEVGAAPAEDGPTVTDGGDVASTDEETVLEEPAVTSQDDSDLVDLLLESLDEETA